MSYLYSVVISFVIMYIVVYLLIRDTKHEKNIFDVFTLGMLLYLSILPVVNIIFAVLFILIPVFDKEDFKRDLE